MGGTRAPAHIFMDPLGSCAGGWGGWGDVLDISPQPHACGGYAAMLRERFKGNFKLKGEVVLGSRTRAHARIL